MNKLIAIPLALMLLISNLSITIGRHYCAGELIITRIMMGEYPCGTEEMDNTCIHAKILHEKFDIDPCCENKYQLIDADFNYTLDPLKAICKVSFLDGSIHPDMKFSFLQKPDKSSFSDYYLPPEIKDIIVLFQIFLI